MKKVKFLPFTITLFFIASGLHAQQRDFSGIWTRNIEKSNAGSLSINSIPVKIIITQDAGQIEIKRISKNYQGDTTQYLEKIKFDGTETSSVVKPNLNKKSSAQWSPDQKGFTENAAYSDDQGNTKQRATEIWTFDIDGKTLKIQLTTTLNNQDYILTEVFDRN
jgi:outer membrane protease